MRFIVLLATAATCWESWRWLAQRTWNSPEEAASLLAALSLVVLTTRMGTAEDDRDLRKRDLTLLSILVLSCGLTGALLPAIVRSGLASIALLYATHLALAPPEDRAPPALFVLGLLATPIVPTLQFYLGYPMRLVSAAVSVVLLQMNGLAVTREGTYLAWRGELMQFDAPCSGVSMLWAGLLLTTMLAYLNRLSTLRLIAALTCCAALLLAANILRATSLFYLEAGLIGTHGSWLHDASGIVAFAACALLIVWSASRFRTPTSVASAQAPRNALQKRVPASMMFGAACLVAAAAPLTAKASADVRNETSASTAWPDSYDGKPLTQLPLSPREVAFTADFPGRIARFTDGPREIIVRQVTTPTRKLHPASDCFRGIGYSITPVPMRRNAAGRAMSCFEAHGRGGSYRICEHLEDGAGGSWPDVGAWYWSALFSRHGGGWWSYVVAERI